MVKKALITGITGQDGSYLAELLLDKGYEVHGLRRRSSNNNLGNVAHLIREPHEDGLRVLLHYGDLIDSSNLNRILEKVQPDEIYNLAAQSDVHTSFQVPDYTAQVVGLGALRLLDAIRKTGVSTRIYQASSSELYGEVLESPQTETTPFNPRSPYAIAKQYAHYMTRNYREAYDIFACAGILFNHESPRRGPSFVTRKVTIAVTRIANGLQDRLYLGNLDAKRDWGHAKDYVEAMWLMLQQPTPDDFVIASGESHSVREFVELAFRLVGKEIEWSGKGVEELGIDSVTGQVLVEIDPYYFRPTEVEFLQGDASKARRILGWTPKTTFSELVEDMIHSDQEAASRLAENK